MKSNPILWIFLAIVCLFQSQQVFGQFDKWKKKVEEKAEQVLDGDSEGRTNKLIAKFEKGQPISTTFDDAIYEADFLGNFEPNENEYRPLDIQPKAEKVGYKLQSGFYTLNARSFCLRGYTYGPSKGDGHLYAPLKGKKADFVQSIIEHFAAKPEVPQQDVQVLIWAIIAGADMNTLGEQHSKTLNSLFTTKELLDLTAKGWADEYVDSQITEWKKSLLGKTPAKLQELLDADEKIRSMVKGNKSFQEIEKVAIIAGVAPRDMIREVSKGRWSYHPDGYFVRFFPNGYPQTRVDVYVPYKDAVQTDASGKAVGLNVDAKESKEVIFNPSGMVASPANRPSQRIGVSPVPVTPTPTPKEKECITDISGKLYPVIPTAELKDYGKSESYYKFKPSEIDKNHVECKVGSPATNNNACIKTFLHYKKEMYMPYETENGKFVIAYWVVDFREDEEHMGTLVGKGHTLYPKPYGDEGEY
jgi:hypothetical protein